MRMHINSRPIGGPRSASTASDHTVSGTYQHEAVQVLQGPSMEELGQKRLKRKRLLHLSTPGEAVGHKTLEARGLQGDRPLARLTSRQLASATRLVQDTGEIRKLGIRLLRGGTPPRADGRRGIMRNYLALRSATALLDDEEDEDDAIALLTPVRGNPGSARELADLLQQAGEDREAVFELMQDVEGLPRDKDELYRLLREARHDPHELAQLLRDRQSLPTRRDEAVAALRQSIQDAARQLESSERGTIFASLNAGDAASTQADPEKFLDAYGELVHGDRHFGERFAQLLERYQPDELRNALPAIKRALADDLAAATQSQDPIRLHAVLSELGHMHVASTLMELVDTMTKQFNRMQAASSASKLERSSLVGELKKLWGTGFVTAGHFQALVENLGLPHDPPAPRIQMLTELRKVLTRLPPAIFQDDKSRLSMLDALQAALNEAIEDEEDALAAADNAASTAPRLH